MERLTSVWGRVRRRVWNHRFEALAMVTFMVEVAAAGAATGASAWLGRFLGGAHAAGLPADVFLAFAACWIPLCVIDYRRCNRETALRCRVEAELEREAAANRAREEEFVAVRLAVEDVLACGGPRIVYQPIVEMATGAVVGYEALSRFADGVVPSEWFARAARVGLGEELELAAVRSALVAIEALTPDVYLSINVSPQTLCSPRLLQELHASSPRRIVLELTEHSAVEDYCEYRAAIARLRREGVRLAVDDAGAGYASFRHIVDLNPDIIKIDGSLVQGAHLDPSRRSLMIAFVSFASDLGASLVAECVEVEPEAEALRGWGVGFGQGWLFGRPAELSAERSVPVSTRR